MISHSEAVETRRCRRCNEPKILDAYRFNEQARSYGRTCKECLSEINHQVKVNRHPKWEIYVGSVRLYLVGPGPHAMLRCSEPVYRGKIGTPEEWNIARKALRILNKEFHQDITADGATIARVLDRARNKTKTKTK